ncbi:MAG: (Fe-S)-binding protein [Candidatus Shapirobacteria bacterium]|nr:(Fe-S)-binding protein [Candidatus Shapirobacteria bacterium]
MSILDKILGGNTLYYPGCLTKFVAKDLEEKYQEILRQEGIDFITLSELELCCGSPALKAGYLADFKKAAKENMKIFKDHGVTKVITNCPACFMILKKYYQEALGKDWNIEVEHISQTLGSKLKAQNSKLQPKVKNLKLTYHDPCHLGRQMGVYDQPRTVIKNLGYRISEMKLNKKNSFCCGGGGGVQSNEPDLASKIAQDRIKQAKETGARILCTACPLCYLHLKENAKGIKVKELSQLFSLNKGKNDHQ